MEYRRDIDGLRAIAILLVTVFHFNLFSVGKAGFVGVDVFFVISGFLITSIILRDLRSGNFSLGGFFYRRIRRLYPAMIATLALYLVVGFWVLLPDMYGELGREALLSQLYVINVYFWRTVNYFGLQVGSVPLLHMWSLAVEEQFYLLFPLFCLIIYRLRPGWVTGAIVLMAVLSFLLGLVATSWKPWAAFYLLPTRGWELLLGSVLAAFCLSYRPQGRLLVLAGPLGLGLIGLAVYLYTPVTGVPGYYVLYPTLGAVFLVLGGFDQQAPTTRMLSWDIMVWIGKISYPLYLVHWPIMILMKTSLPDFSLAWRLGGFIASFVLAWMIYAWVERPLRSGRVLASKKAFLRSAGLGTALLIAASFGISWQNGLPQRFSPEVARALAYSEDSGTRFLHCEDGLVRADQACRLGALGVAPDILVVGDSHANAFAHAIDLWLARTGRAAVFSFAHGCLPVLGLGPPACTRQALAAAEYAQAHPEIETVMLISIWRPPYGEGILARGRWMEADVVESVFADALEETVTAFGAAGKRVVLVDPFFAAPSSVPHAQARNLAFGRDWPTDKSLPDHLQEFAQLFAAFDQAGAAGAERLSLIEEFCASGTCPGIRNGRPVFSDGNHLADWLSKDLSFVFEREFD